MEGGNDEMKAAGGGAPATARWNPTKEQITVLESLYRQGVRTPSAEQIQQISGRLKVFGHIEGKNVFYWFQNHKARQRQKQKQENMVHFNRYLHNSPPLFPPPPNVVCGPYYMPQSDLGFHPQCPNVLLPGGIKSRPTPEKVNDTKLCGGAGYDYEPCAYTGLNVNNECRGNQETLDLFPLHPTGILQGRSSSSSPMAASTSAGDDSITAPSSSSENTRNVEEHDKSFFDFFCGDSPSKTH